MFLSKFCHQNTIGCFLLYLSLIKSSSMVIGTF